MCTSGVLVQCLPWTWLWLMLTYNERQCLNLVHLRLLCLLRHGAQGEGMDTCDSVITSFFECECKRQDKSNIAALHSPSCQHATHRLSHCSLVCSLPYGSGLAYLAEHQMCQSSFAVLHISCRSYRAPPHTCRFEEFKSNYGKTLVTGVWWHKKRCSVNEQLDGVQTHEKQRLPIVLIGCWCL